VIEPAARPSAAWRELWAFRELLFFLMWRDVKVRYRQTALGVGWAVLQPLAAMAVFALFFGRLAGVPSDGIAYPAFVYVALVPWTYVATAVGAGAPALVTNQNLVAKVYFPRLLIPIAAVGTPLVDMVIALALAIVLVGAYGLWPREALLVLPAFTMLAIGAALGATLWLSAITVKYRDVRYTLPFLLQLWLFLSPVAYPSSLVPEPWRVLYAMNPMATVIDGFRWALLGTAPPHPVLLAATTVTVVTIVMTGLWYFRRVERAFADII